MSLPEERLGILKELGQEVQVRREELGLSYEDIYQRTRIQPSYLYAIENADYEVLPDAVYTLGFIRTYLGIIEFDEIYAEFRQWLMVNTRGKEKGRARGRDGGGGMPPYAHPPGFKMASRFWVYAVLLLMIIGAITYVAYSWNRNGIPTSSITLRNEIRPAERTDQFVISVDVESEEQNGDATEDANANVAAPTPEPEPLKPELRIIASDDDCWISVRVGNGRIADRTLKKGETYTFELTDRTRVSYGRPWAVTVVHNGRDIGSPFKGGARKPQVNIYYPDGRSGRLEANQP